jgi:hypothetical protein
MPLACSNSGDQARRPTSSHSVPAASDMSLTDVAVSCRRSQSLGSNTWATRRKISGSCSATHSSFGAVKPGIARLPAICGSDGRRRTSSSHCAALRVSHHRIAGRSTWRSSSTSTAPCIWPDRPIACTADHASGWLARSARAAATSASHQSCGCCSAQCGCGRETVSGAPAVATSVPCESTSASLSSEVPRSMPSVVARALIPAPRRPPCGAAGRRA